MDKKEALKQIKAGDFFLGNADEKLKTDKKFILAVVKHSGLLQVDLDNLHDPEVAEESADLIYHLMILWNVCGVHPNDVFRIIENRKS